MTVLVLPGRFVEWLAGTQAWLGEDDPQAVAMADAVKRGRRVRSGKGYRIEIQNVDPSVRSTLREYAYYLLDITAAGDDDAVARAERRAALAVLERTRQ